ncbi:MAG TPA: hypothetical protein VLK85_08875 [Ramlibacter sp.]|nr:hypothetical protein [Ramlibacter sp.]
MLIIDRGFAGLKWICAGYRRHPLETTGTTGPSFGPRDHFVVPSWHTARLSSSAGCVLFSFSDRPVHQALGIHSEERLP